MNKMYQIPFNKSLNICAVTSDSVKGIKRSGPVVNKDARTVVLAIGLFFSFSNVALSFTSEVNSMISNEHVDGIQNINDGGIANNTTIISGWQDIHGGIANNTTILNDGWQNIFTGGRVDHTIAKYGKVLLAGGTIVNGTIEAGGEIYIDTPLFFGTVGGIIEENLVIEGGLFTDQANIELTLEQGAYLTLQQDRKNFANTNIDLILTGGGAFVQNGNNTVTLLGANSYTGGTYIESGTLLVGGSTKSQASIVSDVFIRDGAILGGYGQIKGSVTVQNGGAVSPGLSVGALTIGSAQFQSGSSLIIEVGEVQSDQLIASSSIGSGTITIDQGSALTIQANNRALGGDQYYTIVEADNGITGTFTNVSSNLLFLSHDIIYSVNNIVLYLSRNGVDFRSVAETVNQKNVADAIEGLNTHHDIYKTIVGLDARNAKYAFNTLSGEVHASAKGAILSNAQYSRNAVYNHLDGRAVSLLENGRGLWIDLWGHTGDLKAHNLGAAKMKNKGFGFLVGSDIVNTESIRLGAAVGYEENELKVEERFSKADTKALHLMLYGQSTIGQFDLSGGIGYSIQNLDVKRDVIVHDLYSHNTAKYNANVLQLFIKAQYHIEITENVNLSPYVVFAYQRLKTKDKIERGRVTNLQIHGKTDNLSTTYLGLESKFRVNDGGQVYLDIAWKHNSKESYYANMSFNDGSQFRVHGASIGKNSAVVGIGGEFDLTSDSKLSIGYEGEFNGRMRDNSLKLQYQYQF